MALEAYSKALRKDFGQRRLPKAGSGDAGELTATRRLIRL